MFAMTALFVVAGTGCQASGIQTETVGSFSVDEATYIAVVSRGLGSTADSSLTIRSESGQRIGVVYWDDRTERLPVRIENDGTEARVAFGQSGSISLARMVKGTFKSKQSVWLLTLQWEEDCIAFAKERTAEILTAYREQGTAPLRHTLDEVSGPALERLPSKILRWVVRPVHQVWLGEAAEPAPSFIKYWECVVPVTVWDTHANAQNFDLNFRGFDFDGAPGKQYQIWTGDRLPTYAGIVKPDVVAAEIP